MNMKSFQPVVALYLLKVPTGTWSVALLYVFVENDLLLLDFPIIVNGFSMKEKTFSMLQSSKALLPMEVTLLEISTDLRLVHS